MLRKKPKTQWNQNANFQNGYLRKRMLGLPWESFSYPCTKTQMSSQQRTIHTYIVVKWLLAQSYPSFPIGVTSVVPVEAALWLL